MRLAVSLYLQLWHGRAVPSGFQPVLIERRVGKILCYGKYIQVLAGRGNARLDCRRRLVVALAGDLCLFLRRIGSVTACEFLTILQFDLSDFISHSRYVSASEYIP